MAFEEFLKSLPSDQAVALYEKKRRDELIKWFLGTFLIALITAATTWYFQFAESTRADQKLMEQTESSRAKLEQEYLSKFLQYGLSSDVDLRIRFAHYFHRISKEPMDKKWKLYYDDLLAAKAGANKSKDGDDTAATADQPLVDSADKIGGVEALTPPSVERRINRIILLATNIVPAERLRQIHMSRGFTDIGYHFLVYPEGNVVRGRSLTEDAAIVTKHNVGTIGIAVPCVTKGHCRLADAQLDSLEQLISGLSQEFNIPLTNVIGAEELADRHDYRENLGDKVRERLAANSGSTGGIRDNGTRRPAPPPGADTQ